MKRDNVSIFRKRQYLHATSQSGSDTKDVSIDL